MIESMINYIFRRTDRTWKIGDSRQVPSEEDILRALDQAAEELINQPDMDVLTVGGIKLERNERGRFDVYVFVGEFI